MCNLCDRESEWISIDGLFAVKLTVTPSMAAKILGEHNKNNRSVKSAQVERLAEDITEGRWQPDVPDFIGFDTSMTLVSGQHRLLAILKAERSVPLRFVFGLPSNSRDAEGAAIARTMADMAGANGVDRYPAVYGRAHRMVVVWDLGKIISANCKPSRVNLSKSKISARMSDYPALKDSVQWTMDNRRTFKGIPSANIAFGHYLLLNRTNASEKALEFWQGCLNRRKLADGDPRVAMLDLFDRVARSGSDSKVQGIYIYGIVKAWNMWVAGDLAKQFTYKRRKSRDGVDTIVFNDIPALARSVDE